MYGSQPDDSHPRLGDTAWGPPPERLMFPAVNAWEPIPIIAQNNHNFGVREIDPITDNAEQAPAGELHHFDHDPEGNIAMNVRPTDTNETMPPRTTQEAEEHVQDSPVAHQDPPALGDMSRPRRPGPHRILRARVGPHRRLRNI